MLLAALFSADGGTVVLCGGGDNFKKLRCTTKKTRFI